MKKKNTLFKAIINKTCFVLVLYNSQKYLWITMEAFYKQVFFLHLITFFHLFRVKHITLTGKL